MVMLVASILAGCTGPGTDDGPLVVQVPSPFTSWTDDVTSQIRSGALAGANVREGGFWYLKHEGCGPVVLETGTCFGAHPASPYGMFDFPEDDNPDSDDILDYKLDQHEALLFVGHTPPEARYFSFNHHQYRKAMADGAEEITFATMAPAMHLLELSTANSPLTLGSRRDITEVPFQDYTVVIFTANQTTADRLIAQLTPILEDAGYDPEIINIHVIAYANEADAAALVSSGQLAEDEVFTLTMGYGPGTDTYNVVMRVGAVDDDTHPYMFPETINAAAFKIAFDDPPAYDPFPWPEFPPPDETGEQQSPRLQASQEAVVQAVIDQLMPPAYTYQRVDAPRLPQKTGASCINLLDTCGANNDDARYHRSEQRFAIPSLDATGSIFLVGVNHTVVTEFDPNAPRVTYISLTLNNFTRGFGVVTRLDHELEGSLDFWFDPEDLPDEFDLEDDQLDSIYIVQYARDCSQFNWEDRYGRPNPYCIEFDDQLLGICPLDKFWFTERVYLNQTSGTAPATESVFSPIALAIAPTVTWTPGNGTGGNWDVTERPDPPEAFGDWCLPPGQRD